MSNHGRIHRFSPHTHAHSLSIFIHKAWNKISFHLLS
uniref:Uncharacterized protein n=1 Tax=Rhizophora mucronata TaxID=61149 RepID=A0A2P2N3V8_RHIMU